jgi:acetyl-CoA carboxylase biotin carboxyl carrier protein
MATKSVGSSNKKAKVQSDTAIKARGLDLDHLESVLKLLTKHGVGEFEWTSGEDRLHVKSQMAASLAGGVSVVGPHVTSMQAHPLSPVAATGQPPVGAAPIAPAPAQMPAVPVKPTAAHPKAKEVESPFVGTFYRSPSPSADSYVREGQSVKKGDTLCIIEAMKLMNEIEAEMDGKIVKILVENGQPVEFGEPLFLMEPV